MVIRFLNITTSSKDDIILGQGHFDMMILPSFVMPLLDNAISASPALCPRPSFPHTIKCVSSLFERQYLMILSIPLFSDNNLPTMATFLINLISFEISNNNLILDKVHIAISFPFPK